MAWTKYIGQYILLMMLQVFLFDQLQLLGVCHPFIYILFLLMMPITLPHSVDMFIGAIVGLIMDIFSNSLGVHTSTCVLLMFFRPYLLGTIINDKDRLNEQISTRVMGLAAMGKYLAILIIIHHFMVFILSAWSWAHIGFVLVETIVSAIITFIFIFGFNILKYK